jgi:hypothetical protein
MAFKIKDGLRIGTVDVFNNSGVLLVNAPTATKSTNIIGGNGTTLLGSLPYQSSTDTTSLLSPNTTTSIRVLTQTGDGTNGAAPVWTASTGTGSVVFATAPTFTTSIDGGATFGAFASSTALTLGYTGTSSSTHNIGTGAVASSNTKTINIGTGGAAGSSTNINLGSSSGGTVTVNNDITVTGNLTVNGTTTTVNSTTVTVDDINIELGSVASPTDSTANGGGITLKGTTDKTITYDNANTQWTSNQDWNIASGKSFKINNTSVLNATTLGSGVTGSSLTSVGTIGTGVWQGTAVAAAYGGTGQTSYTVGDLLYASTTTALSKLSAGTSGYILTSGGAGVAPSWTAPASVNASNLSGTTLNATIVTSSLTTVGTIGTGTWQGTVIGAAYGGTGVANNSASTLTISGAYGTTLTVSGTTSITLPTSGTVATLAGTETFTNKSFNSSFNQQASAVTIANNNVIQTTLATTSATTVDSWAKATYRSAKYLIQVTQGSNYQVSEIMIIQDSTNTYMTEFAVIETNGVLATFTSSIVSANAVLTVTMASATSATINIQRTLLVV